MLSEPPIKGQLLWVILKCTNRYANLIQIYVMTLKRRIQWGTTKEKSEGWNKKGVQDSYAMCDEVKNDIDWTQRVTSDEEKAKQLKNKILESLKLND